MLRIGTTNSPMPANQSTFTILRTEALIFAGAAMVSNCQLAINTHYWSSIQATCSCVARVLLSKLFAL